MERAFFLLAQGSKSMAAARRLVVGSRAEALDDTIG